MLEEITDANTFWRYVKQGGSIHDVTVVLNSPNLFSGFFEIGKMLTQIRELYNNTQTTLKVTNKNAPLSGITKDNSDLAEAIKYASAGGGEWSLTMDTKDGNRTYRSKNNIKKVNLIPVIESPIDDDVIAINADVIKALDTVDELIKRPAE